MARKRFSDEDILYLVRQIELSLASGSDVTTACRSAGMAWLWDAGRNAEAPERRNLRLFGPRQGQAILLDKESFEYCGSQNGASNAGRPENVPESLCHITSGREGPPSHSARNDGPCAGFTDDGPILRFPER